MTHTPTDEELLQQANFNKIIIDALEACSSCCLDNKEEVDKAAHSVLQSIRESASYEEFVKWREIYDCDMLLDSFDTALAWLSGRGVFDQGIPEIASDWRDREDVRDRQAHLEYCSCGGKNDVIVANFGNDYNIPATCCRECGLTGRIDA
ncbi:hypothetical protein LCGC14_0672920 [marine sediment metagenome]|uniref:Uncharacterized protein n=1 Tax=marine sediment metagenome TaxID=412755 RepID=A0A0F9RAS0_9ZZZZ